MGGGGGDVIGYLVQGLTFGTLVDKLETIPHVCGPKKYRFQSQLKINSQVSGPDTQGQNTQYFVQLK